MVRKAWGAWTRTGWILMFAGVSGACGGAGTRAMCPLPPEGTPQGTLAIHQLHEFGSDYDVVSATYYLDDCIILRTDDTALLKKPKLDFESKPVAPGARQFRYAIEFRSGFSADMHAYTWGMTGGAALKIGESAATSVTLRMFEDERADPRNRMRIMMMIVRPK